MKLLDRFVVALAVGAHFTYLAYVPSGGFLALRWPRTIWLHVPSVVWAAAIVGLHFPCPLTWLESTARTRAGMSPLPSAGFINHYVEGVLYPANANATRAAQMLAISAAGLSWIAVAGATRRRHRRRRSKGP